MVTCGTDGKAHVNQLESQMSNRKDGESQVDLSHSRQKMVNLIWISSRVEKMANYVKETRLEAD